MPCFYPEGAPDEWCERHASEHAHAHHHADESAHA